VAQYTAEVSHMKCRAFDEGISFKISFPAASRREALALLARTFPCPTYIVANVIASEVQACRQA
jgi:hypothetical protein